MNAVASRVDKEISFVEAVARKVPARVVDDKNDCTGLHYVPLENGREPYYHFGINFRGRWLNLHFYGLAESDFGRVTNFDVTVWEKMVNNVTYTFLNLDKSSEQADYDLKLGATSGSVKIAGTSLFIDFVPRKA